MRKSEVSIHDQLKPLFDRCDPGKNDHSALEPSPIVNASLSKLVDCLCRHIGRDSLLMDNATGSVLLMPARGSTIGFED